MTVKLAILGVIAAVLAGCAPKSDRSNELAQTSSTSAKNPQHSAPTHASTALHALALSDLSAAEKRFGRAPRRDPTVTYQPGVILMDEGADAIKSVAADGLTWRVDPRASHASEMAVGRVIFVTNRCVGRVLHLERSNDEVAVMVGPVELTDIFQDLDVSFEGPIDRTQALAYSPPQLPGMRLPIEDPPDPTSAHLAPRRPRPEDLMNPLLLKVDFPAGTAGILPVIPPLQLQTAKPLSNADGVGMEFYHDSGQVHLKAQAQLRLNAPRFEFSLAIHGASVTATVILHNAAGLRLAFDAAVGPDFSGNVNWYVPYFGEGISLSGPAALTIDIRQEMWVETDFTAKNGSFSAGGDYGLNADFGVVVHDTAFRLIGPDGFTVNKSMMANMSGVSFRPKGLVLKHQVSVTGGFGGLGFTVGPAVHILTTVGAALGSDEGIIRCQRATLKMQVQGGVGWTTLRPLMRFVNTFLSLFKVAPIPDHGGAFSHWFPLFEQTAATGGDICGGSRS